MDHRWFSDCSKEELTGLNNQEIKRLATEEYEQMLSSGSAYPSELKNLREIIRRINENNFSPSKDLHYNNGALRIILNDNQDDVTPNSFNNAAPSFDRPKRQSFKLFANAPTPMSKWFNTTFGFVCGVFGGLLIVTLTGAITAAVGALAVTGITYLAANINLQRCTREYIREFDSTPTEEIIQECRIKVGLGRSDGKDSGYWKS